MIASRSRRFSRLQRCLVAFNPFVADGPLERRRASSGMFVLELDGVRRARVAPHLVTNAVVHGLPEVGLKRSLVTIFEGRQRREGVQHHILDDILRVAEVSRKARQPPARPPPERRQAAFQECIERSGVTLSDALQETGGRLDQPFWLATRRHLGKGHRWR